MFLLGALFEKLMDESRLVRAIADFMTKPPGERRAILADGRKQNGDVE
jgi:H+/gluconate symporter-like permease